MSEVALHSLQAHQSNGAKDAKDSSHDKENDRSRAAAPRGEGAARGVKAGTFEVCLKGEWRPPPLSLPPVLTGHVSSLLPY
mgnify:CR=1 FL=1|jgi:hypothetical protein